MAAGRDRHIGKLFTRPLEAAVSIVKDHIVVSIDASGDLILCTNTATPYAITNRSTQDKFQSSVGKTAFLNGADLGGAEIALFRSGMAELQLGSDNIAIKVGDRIICHADDDGTVNGAAAEAAHADSILTVGFAESVVGTDAGGVVLVALKLHVGDAI